MKKVIVIAAGLGFEDLDRRHLLKMEGLEFKAGKSVFPALTCVAQASLRTGSIPREHGIVSNGFYFRDLKKTLFWEQSSSLVEGERVWKNFRASGKKVGMYFWQQSMGEDVDTIISPAPVHKHDGGMVMSNYTKPTGMSDILSKVCGNFPLYRYWGPLASAKVGRKVIENFIAMTEAHEMDVSLIYLPTLDYEAQRFGPASKAADKAILEFRHQLASLAAYCSRTGSSLTVIGDYAIGEVVHPPAFPNTLLRKRGFLNVRKIKGGAYLDLCSSRAFAMCDHEIAHVYVSDPSDIEEVMKIFVESGEYESVELKRDQPWAHKRAGEILLCAKKGSWCSYPWWEDNDEAPDYASHVDIHSKPGYDPCELFFGSIIPPSTSLDQSRIKGTHGRESLVAWASTERDFDYCDMAKIFQ